MSDEGRLCPIDGCEEAAPENATIAFCKDHWRQVPGPLQDLLFRFWWEDRAEEIWESAELCVRFVELKERL